MADSPDGPPERARPATVAELADSVDRRFDAVDEALVEQRRYTEFAFDRLKQEMASGFGRVEHELGVVKTGVHRLEQEMVIVKSGLGRLECKLDRLIDGEPPTPKTDPPKS